MKENFVFKVQSAADGPFAFLNITQLQTKTIHTN